VQLRRSGARTAIGAGAATTSRFLAVRLGALLLFAGGAGGASLCFPPAPDADNHIAYLSAGLAVLLGLVLLAGALDRAPLGAFKLIIALATVLAALGTYGSGSPIGGGAFFFLWVSPYAFAFFGTRQAILQASFVAIAYGIVLVLQNHFHPQMASSPGVLVGPWIVLVSSDLAIGILVRHLGRSVRDVDRRFRRGFESSPVAAAFLDLDLSVLEVNDALCRLLGRHEADLVGTRLTALSHPDDLDIAPWLLVDSAGGTVESEARFVLPDGSTVWTEVAGSLVEPELGPAYRFCQFRDVTELRRDRALLAHQAIHDPLTGLYNRTMLLERTTAALSRRVPGGPTVGLVLLDLDQFKMVNDSLGHEAGDAVLVALAPRLSMALETNDIVGRLGGDEFVVLLDHVANELDAVQRAERIRRAISVPIPLGAGEFVATASIGVTIASTTDADATGLLRDADAAMYRAKARGRDHIELFDQSMRFEVLQRLQLERDLREAIAARQLYLEFQPIVDITTGRPVLLEALVRWDHPQRGRVAPDEFIPLAEQTGLIVDLGYWVLETAVAELEGWQMLYASDPPIGLSVNVSGHQLASPGFVDRVEDLLEQSAITPGSLGIEITESVIIDVRFAHEALDSLRSLGVLTLLDDFGTGYSSLAYLEQFPIDILKIDRSFIARLDEDSDRAVVLEAIFAMARALHLDVIAEGVENAGQVSKLRDLGCPLVQGFVIARPLPASGVVDYLTEQHTLARAFQPGR
jgi:diguanylate cyclase (GGDEF)-like protein/PAS domain S-box-containing protein